MSLPNGIVPEQEELLGNVLEREEVKWANERSIEMRIETVSYLHRQVTEFRYIAVLKEKDVAFWRLKFYGRSNQAL